jgi:hypothetical protein
MKMRSGILPGRASAVCCIRCPTFNSMEVGTSQRGSRVPRGGGFAKHLFAYLSIPSAWLQSHRSDELLQLSSSKKCREKWRGRWFRQNNTERCRVLVHSRGLAGAILKLGKKNEVVPGIELGLPESESDVLTITLYNQLLRQILMISYMIHAP